MSLLLIGLLQFLTLLVGVMRTKGLSISLGPDGFGVVGTIDQIVLTVTQIGAFGIPFTALRFMSRAHSQNAEDFRRVSNHFLRLVAVLSLSSMVLAGTSLLVWPALAGPEMGRHLTPLLISFLGMGPVMITMHSVNVLAAAQKSAAAAALALSVAALSALGAILGSFLGGISGLYIASCTAALIAAIVALSYLRTATGVSMWGHGSAKGGVLPNDRAILITALSIYVTMVFYTGSLLVVRYGVLAQAGETAAGLLQAALSVALSAGSILATINNLYLVPAINRAGSIEEKLKQAHDFAGRALALFMLGAIPLMLFPGLTMRILYTAAFYPAATMIAGFLAWQCIFQLVSVYQQLLIGLNQLPFMAFAASAGFGAAAILSVVLGGAYGPGWVSLSLIAGAMLSGSLMVTRLYVRYGMTIPVQVMLRVTLVIATIAITYLFFSPLDEGTLAGIALRMFFAAVAYGAIAFLLTPQERTTINGVANAIWRRLGLCKPSSLDPAS